MQTNNGDTPAVLGQDSDGDGSSIERIADPDNYTVRRRLKQLHDAKREVVQIKNVVIWDRLRKNSDYGQEEGDRLVAERLVDYIHELRPVLEMADSSDVFLSEDVGTFNDRTVTIRLIMETRGEIPHEQYHNQAAYLPYEMSMDAWNICNTYFEEVAGSVFEEGSPEPGANPVDPAGRFDHD